MSSQEHASLRASPGTAPTDPGTAPVAMGRTRGERQTGDRDDDDDDDDNDDNNGADDDGASGARAIAVRAETSFASVSQDQFVEPWHRRVRDVDDHTVAGLLQQLISLRRMRNFVATFCCVMGMGVFGQLDVHGLYALLIYGVLAAMVGMPVFAIGSLSVRRLFLREARRQGLSRSAAMLVLTRAERRARLLKPWQRDDAKIDALLQAVREPDTAS